jgi:hypothetical protein
VCRAAAELVVAVVLDAVPERLAVLQEDVAAVRLPLQLQPIPAGCMALAAACVFPAV